MAARRILVIHGDPLRAARLALELRDEGYTMETATDADTEPAAAPFDRVIVDDGTRYEEAPGQCPSDEPPDVGFPPITLRSRGNDLVVVLAVRSNDFWPPVLAARPARPLQAIADDADPPTGVVLIGDVWLDHRSRQVHLQAEEVWLEAAEFDVLAVLMEHAGRVVTRTDLVQAIWPDDGGCLAHAPDAYIASLRRKLDHPVNVPSHISTIRGIGYRFATG